MKKVKDYSIKKGMSVKEFTKVLDLYLINEKAKAKANNNG